MTTSSNTVAITMTVLLVLGSAASASRLHSATWSRNRTEYVETRVGSGGAGWGIGMLNPGSQVPYGAMRLGPDTSVGTGPFQLSFDQFSGYYYFNDFIECLSHTHVVGAGEGDFQNFGVMVTRTFNDNIIRNRNYRSHYSHQQEVALPGYYAVNLLTPNVFAELTTTGTHTGLHRYTARSTYPEDLGQSYLLIDVCHGFGLSIFDTDTKSACVRAQIVNVSLADDGISYELDAWIFNKGSFSQSSNRGGIYLYYHAVISAFDVDESTGSLSPIPLAVLSWENDTATAGSWYKDTTVSGSLGVAFASQTPRTNTDTTQYLIRAGISFISNANARINLLAQQPDKSLTFDGAVQDAINEWEDHQQTIRYSGGAANNDIRVRSFETALYNVARPPTTYSESNNEYLGEDWNVHSVQQGTRYVSDLSIWDIYRSQAPLLAFIKPTIARDLANSMLEMVKETGELPVWVFANVETYCMVGHHSAIIFADYVLKGLPGINHTAILNAVVSQINLQNAQNLEPYGFVPLEANQRGASLTLDYAIDAGAAANLAAFLNDTTAAATLSAKSYRNQWDNTSMYFFPRFANGTFQNGDPYLSYPFNTAYTEGDGAEYRWYVPHDISGLINLFPNVTYFADQLDEFFAFSTLWAVNTTLPNPAFWAGNEPDILAPFLFVFAGNEYAYLTNVWVEETLNTYYFPYASGIPGNDDYGTMSAWVVYAHLGFYPVASTDTYALFAPLFDDVELTLDRTELMASPWAAVVQPNSTGARTTILRVKATGRPASGTTYVTSIHVNGKLLPSQSVTHAQLVALDSSVAPYTLIEFTLSGEPTVYGAEVSEARGGPSVFIPSSRKWTDDERESHKDRFQAYANDATARLKDGTLSPSLFKKDRMPPKRNTAQ
jgi:predicted alpha-1,2-mannosidase